jgi:hypothetical protein
MIGDLRVSLDVSLTPTEAFDSFVDELLLTLEMRGLKFEVGADGSISEGDAKVGTVEEWTVGKRISLIWRPKSWQNDLQNRTIFTFEASNNGTNIVFESKDWGRILGDDKKELTGWFANEVISQLLSASAPNRLGG